MRSSLRHLTILTVVVVVAIVAVVLYERRENAYRVRRAQEIVSELRRLEIGKSDLSVADAIVKKFGNAPLPEGWTKYTKDYCAAPDRSDDCVYMLSMNNSSYDNLYLNHDFLSRLLFHRWSGFAAILLKGGKVTDYWFIVWYRASNSRLRGFGAHESRSRLRFEPDQARISDSYSVPGFHTGHTSPEYGLGLESWVTPSANATERERAFHVDFGCLAGDQGCGEVCEIMPEAWRDFYETHGRLDVERCGSDYLLCSSSPQ